MRRAAFALQEPTGADETCGEQRERVRAERQGNMACIRGVGIGRALGAGPGVHAAGWPPRWRAVCSVCPSLYEHDVHDALASTVYKALLYVTQIAVCGDLSRSVTHGTEHLALILYCPVHGHTVHGRRICSLAKLAW